MSYYINLQKAIDYIEEHVYEKPGIDQIARVAGYSIPHFYRVFGAIVGCSVSEYLRRRKLSRAAYDVAATKRSITEIAFEHGFESHEVFTRTFKSLYGVPPSVFREERIEPDLFEKPNLLAIEKERRMITMKPKIVCKEEKHLLGIARRMNQSENVKNNLIGKAQEEYRGMIGVIKNRVGADVFYAVYDYNPEDIQKDDDEINYTYWFCVEVDSCDEIPDGMAVKTVPQGKYAVFVFDVEEGTLNGEKLDCDVYDFIDGVWLPNSGFELSDEPDFEVILEKDQRVEYYISIR